MGALSVVFFLGQFQGCECGFAGFRRGHGGDLVAVDLALLFLCGGAHDIRVVYFCSLALWIEVLVQGKVKAEFFSLRERTSLWRSGAGWSSPHRISASYDFLRSTVFAFAYR